MNNSQLAMVLSGQGVEMFELSGDAWISHQRQQYIVEDAPVEAKSIVLDFINSCAKRKEAYTAMAGNNPDAQISQCIKCMFAKLDGTPDIATDGSISTEYVQCPKRGGACKYEGIACAKLKIGSALISPGQERVISNCSLSYEKIGEKLFISAQTVKRHMQDVLKKTGIEDKTNLALAAKEIGILN